MYIIYHESSLLPSFINMRSRPRTRHVCSIRNVVSTWRVCHILHDSATNAEISVAIGKVVIPEFTVCKISDSGGLVSHLKITFKAHLERRGEARRIF